MEGIVTSENLAKVVGRLAQFDALALDTETTGLRPYHGDRMFSLVIACSETEAYYFNFKDYGNGEPYLNLPETLLALRPLFEEPRKTWAIHNAKYDMAILAAEGIELVGQVHCTMSMARVEYSDIPPNKFGLDDLLKKHDGWAKSDAPKTWLKDNNLVEKYSIPGRIQKKKNYPFHLVPYDIIVPYALMDAKGCYKLYVYQTESILAQTEVTPKGRVVDLKRLLENERRLTKTVFAMERRGVLIDVPYTENALRHEQERQQEILFSIEDSTGLPFKDGPLFYKQVFKDEKWVLGEPTKKKGVRNPKFDSDTLKTFSSPVAKMVLNLRDAKSKSDFYSGFLYHKDANGYIHPSFNPHGAVHGRFSSNDPNFQNLTAEDVYSCPSCGKGYSDEGVCQKDQTPIQKKDYLVRRAIIAPPGYTLVSIDYDTMEYRFMLEYACIFAQRLLPLGKRILDGEDYHDAMVDMAKKVVPWITRGKAKTCNFLDLYGGGVPLLAAELGISVEAARDLKTAMRNTCPEISMLQKSMQRTAQLKGYVRNWLGRRCYMTNPNLLYKTPNYIIAGGCADVMKIAMNRMHERLLGTQSYMAIQVHDEADFYIHNTEMSLVPELKNIMENVFPYKYIPLKCSVSQGKNFAELEAVNG